MTGIVLSASVRQNLLSLQSTAALLATTQNDLSTGNKVNTALDNPTSFFTAAALNNRAGDISNLLDGIGNGVQVLQAANTGITSLQSLVASAQSVANQVLQSPVGYSTKSSISSAAITGATANNLLGVNGSPTDATFTAAAAASAVTAAVPAAAANETGTTALTLVGGGVALTTSELGTTSGKLDLSSLAGKTFTVGTQIVQFNATATATDTTTTPGTTVIGLGSGTTSTLGDILTALQTGSGTGTAGVNGSGDITLATTTTGGDFNFTGADASTILTALGLTGSNVDHTAAVSPGTTPLVTGTLLSGVAAGANSALSTGFANNDTITVDGKTLTFSSTNPTSTTANGGTISTTGTVQDLLDAIDKVTGSSGANAASIVNGEISLHTGTAAPLTITSTNSAALGALGLGSSVNQPLTPATSSLSGETLTIGATGGGTATNITFGTAAGDVSTLNQLNAQLAANNLQASIDSTGVLTITTSNNAASVTIGTIGGTAAATGGAFAAFNGVTGPAATADPNSQATRAGLISQYNNILAQINTTSQDSSFNGINLLQGDTLNLTFDETGKSTLAIQGVTFNTAGLDLSPLKAGTDFLDNNSANSVLASLQNASSTLRSEASSLGSNLSIVEIRQDFSKNLINVLQTGASNLTLADTNEEAANSQALSTRQSIAVSALALANQSQQSVLQLLR
jgi:flagellin